MDREVVVNSDEPHWADAYEGVLTRNGERKARGSYYTPRELVDCLIDGALAPAIEHAYAAGDPEQAILALRVFDPACGTGRLLRAVVERLVEALVRVRGDVGAEGWARAVDDVTRACVLGMDNDPIAVEWCRRALGSEQSVRVGDALFADIEEEFDVVLANPPFLNGVEGGVDANVREQLRARYPLVRGTADLAYYFLAASLEWVKDGGWVGMIQPRPALNTPSLAKLRAAVTLGQVKGLSPNVLMVPKRSNLFSGALVFACAVVLGPRKVCRVSDDDVKWNSGMVEAENWWLAARRIGQQIGIALPTGILLGDLFDVRAGMTAGEAYDLKPFVVDSQRGKGPRLVTTGLIDPGESLWGKRRCRYLKEDYAHPRVKVDRSASKTLLKRLDQSRRPKVMVAGLSRRIECFLDEKSQHIGAVSTFGIFHAKDDLTLLQRVCDYLLGDAAARSFADELGGNAVGGGDTVMKKAFLKGLVLKGWEE